MGYLFDPDNWEWLVTGNNARFLLEGFLVNVQIALIAMVFSLIFGLALALGRLLAQRAGRLRRRAVDRRVAQPAAAARDPLRRTSRCRSRGATSTRTSAPGFFPEALQSGARVRRPAGARALQLRRPGRDHARRHPVAGPRPERGRRGARPDLLAADADRDPAPGPAADAAGHRLAAHHAQQGHDARLHHRHRGGHAPRRASSPASTSSAACRRRCCRSSSSSGSCSSSRTSRCRGCRAAWRSASASAAARRSSRSPAWRTRSRRRGAVGAVSRGAEPAQPRARAAIRRRQGQQATPPRPARPARPSNRCRTAAARRPAARAARAIPTRPSDDRGVAEAQLGVPPDARDERQRDERGAGARRLAHAPGDERDGDRQRGDEVAAGEEEAEHRRRDERRDEHLRRADERAQRRRDLDARRSGTMRAMWSRRERHSSHSA